MQQIDTNKIKTMTSDRIAYTLYERNRIMKKKKLKKALFLCRQKNDVHCSMV